MTNSDELYKKLVLFGRHGITRNPDWMENTPEGPWYYEQIELGYNYRMTDIQAALLLSQLDKLEMFKARRKEIVKRYNEAFSQMPQITVQEEIPESDTTRHLYILRIMPEALTIDRKGFSRRWRRKISAAMCTISPPIIFHIIRNLDIKRAVPEGGKAV